MRWGIAVLLGLCLAAALSGCPRKQLPPDLPPPVYEKPRVSPWPPAGEAGADAFSVEPPELDRENPDATEAGDASDAAAAEVVDGGVG